MSSMATKFLLTPFSSRSCGRAAFLLCCHGNAACIHPWSCLSPSCRGPVCIPPWSCLFPPLVLPASLPGSAAAECHQAPPSGLPGGSPISANTGQNIIRDEKREREEGAPSTTPGTKGQLHPCHRLQRAPAPHGTHGIHLPTPGETHRNMTITPKIPGDAGCLTHTISPVTSELRLTGPGPCGASRWLFVGVLLPRAGRGSGWPKGPDSATLRTLFSLQCWDFCRWHRDPPVLSRDFGL